MCVCGRGEGGWGALKRPDGINRYPTPLWTSRVTHTHTYTHAHTHARTHAHKHAHTHTHTHSRTHTLTHTHTHTAQRSRITYMVLMKNYRPSLESLFAGKRWVMAVFLSVFLLAWIIYCFYQGNLLGDVYSAVKRPDGIIRCPTLLWTNRVSLSL